MVTERKAYRKQLFSLCTQPEAKTGRDPIPARSISGVFVLLIVLCGAASGANRTRASNGRTMGTSRNKQYGMRLIVIWQSSRNLPEGREPEE